MWGAQQVTTAQIREALEKAGIPRAAFQIAQLVGTTEGAIKETLKNMVRNGVLDVVARSILKPPKLYMIAVNAPVARQKTHSAPPKEFLAQKIEDKYLGYRWRTRGLNINEGFQIRNGPDYGN